MKSIISHRTSNSSFRGAEAKRRRTRNPVTSDRDYWIPGSRSSAGAVMFAAGAAAAQAPAKGVPALESVDSVWLAFGVHWFDPPAGLGRGPIRQDPAFPF